MTDLRELTEQAHRLAKLQENPDWPILEAYVSKTIEAEQRYLMNGNAKTVEEYRAKAGWVQGAQFVLSAAVRCAKQLEREIITAKEKAA